MDTTFDVENLSPAHRYVFYVCAANEAGLSNKSNCIEYISPQSAPDSPQNLSIEPISTSELQLNWATPVANGSPILLYRIFVYKLCLQSTSNNDLNFNVNSKNLTRILKEEHVVPATENLFIINLLEAETSYEYV